MSSEQKSTNRESWAEITGLDRWDVLLIVLAVVVSQLLKYQHWFDQDTPNWVFDVVLPLALIAVGYKVRGWQRAREERREQAKRWPPSEGRNDAR